MIVRYKDMSTLELFDELEKEMKNEDFDRIIAICEVLVSRPRVGL